MSELKRYENYLVANSPGEERMRNLRLNIAVELYTHQEAMRAASALDAADAFIAEWKRREGK